MRLWKHPPSLIDLENLRRHIFPLCFTFDGRDCVVNVLPSYFLLVSRVRFLLLFLSPLSLSLSLSILYHCVASLCFFMASCAHLSRNFLILKVKFNRKHVLTVTYVPFVAPCFYLHIRVWGANWKVGKETTPAGAVVVLRCGVRNLGAARCRSSVPPGRAPHHDSSTALWGVIRSTIAPLPTNAAHGVFRHSNNS